MTAVLPDSIDSLNLTGIMPFDVKTYIKDGRQVTLASQKDVLKMMSGAYSQDEFIPLNNENKAEDKAEKPKKKHHKFNPKLGILGASLLFLAYAVLRKKCSKVGEFVSKIGSNITKIFKK